jgi:hypothetical protein
MQYIIYYIGTLEERGILKWRENAYSTEDSKELKHVQYEWPFFTKYIQKLRCCSYFPISPTFKEIPIKCCGNKDKDSYDMDIETKAEDTAF